jgi:hypothetical protein
MHFRVTASGSLCWISHVSLFTRKPPCRLVLGLIPPPPPSHPGSKCSTPSTSRRGAVRPATRPMMHPMQGLAAHCHPACVVNPSSTSPNTPWRSATCSWAREAPCVKIVARSCGDLISTVSIALRQGATIRLIRTLNSSRLLPPLPASSRLLPPPPASSCLLPPPPASSRLLPSYTNLELLPAPPGSSRLLPPPPASSRLLRRRLHIAMPAAVRNGTF